MRELLDTFQSNFDNLIDIYSGSEFYSEIKMAKEEYLRIWGEIRDDDPNHEARINQFLDWYIFDRVLDGINLTPIQHYIKKNSNFESDMIKYMYYSMADTLRSMFLVTKVGDKIVKIRDMLTKKRYILKECDYTFIFKEDQYVDARLVITGRGIIMTKGFCLHPIGSAKYIGSEMKLIRKTRENSEDKKEVFFEFLKKLNDKYNLALVYKHVDIERVYSKTPLRG